MTSRPRPKRTTNDSSSSAPKSSGGGSGARKKTTTRRGRSSAGGAAEKRPPRVSRPPSILSSGPKKPAAKPAAPAKKAPPPKPAAAQPPAQPRPAPQQQPVAQQRPPQQPRAGAPHPQHQQPRPPQNQQHNQRPHDHRPLAQRPDAVGGQHDRGGHQQRDHRQQQPSAPRPQQHQHAASLPHHTPIAPAAPAASHAAPPPPPAPKQQLGNQTAEGFNKKAHEEIFATDTKFADLGLNEWVLKGVTEAGFEYPTSIQAKLIPTILTGRDVLGQAKTGTGKTAAFALPMLNAIGKGDKFGGLCLVPTRELAIQVATDFRELGRYTGLNVLPVYGGQSINTQAQALARGPEIIVATPGRVMDMVQRGYMHHHNVKMVVLDEVDRMLDIGFRDDIRRILSTCPKERQTIFVSATMPPEVEQLARSFSRDCEKIIASAGALTVALVKQFYLSVEPWDKKQLLLHLLTHESPALTVVFCRTKRTVDNLAEYLTRKGIDAHAIHGDMQQGRRNRVIEELRSGKLAVLIASDLASRGLDIEGISHVINYDLPEDPDLYVHRIGRTARAGREGVAWALVTPEQGGLLTDIELLINAEIPKLDYPDFKPGPLPADVQAERDRGEQRRADGPKAINRYAQTQIVPAAAPASGGAPAVTVDASKFPGGIVPSKLPPKVMYGRVKSARSMRQAPAANPAAPTSAPPKPIDPAANGESQHN